MTPTQTIPGTYTEARVIHVETRADVGRLRRIDRESDLVFVVAPNGRIVRWAIDSVAIVQKNRPCFVAATLDGRWSAPFDTLDEAVLASEYIREFGHTLPERMLWN